MAKVFADDVVLNYTGSDPYLACLATAILDASGNNNGRIDPGETVDLNATLKNIGGVDFTNLNSTLVSSDPYITITDNSGSFGYLAVDSTKENSADPYTLSASASTPQGHVAEFLLIANDGAFADTFNLSFVIGSYHYMVWNPDPTAGPGMVMDDILSNLGYTGDYTTILPESADLEMYRAIFVCVGIYPSNYVITSNSPEAAALEDYLTAGGNLYLEGGDVWYFDPLGSGYNFCPLFGITATADGYSDGGPFIGQNATFTEEMNFNYGGENSYIDHISPTGTGFLIFRDGDQMYDCGVANDASGNYKTVGLSFELGGLIDTSVPSTKETLLDSIMHFFGITTGIEELTTLDVKTTTMQLSPNPFSNLIRISFSTGNSTERTELKIYDATGRAVRSLNPALSIENQSSSVIWDGCDDRGRKLPNGIYFVHLDTQDTSETAKIILVD